MLLKLLRAYNSHTMTEQERILRLENAFSTLVELARTQSERMDEYERRTEELARTQRETAEMLREVADAQKRLARAQEELTEAQKTTEANLSALTIIMADLGRAQARTERALASLTERFDQHVSSGEE